jgi:predicted AAA+ superfamily ATPase
MESAEFLRIAADWSHWDAPPKPTVPRSVAVPSTLRPDVALIIQGVRRCGKSTLLRQLVDRYSLDRSRCLFINFEDPRLAPALDHTTLRLHLPAR